MQKDPKKRVVRSLMGLVAKRTTDVYLNKCRQCQSEDLTRTVRFGPITCHRAKRYAPHSSIGRPEIQGFVGSLVGLGASKGVFVTTSTFSAPAVEYVRGLQQRVILIDGARLTELMVEFGVGVRLNRTVEFKRLDEDFFSDEN